MTNILVVLFINHEPNTSSDSSIYTAMNKHQVVNLSIANVHTLLETTQVGMSVSAYRWRHLATPTGKKNQIDRFQIFSLIECFSSSFSCSVWHHALSVTKVNRKMPANRTARGGYLHETPNPALTIAGPSQGARQRPGSSFDKIHSTQSILGKIIDALFHYLTRLPPWRLQRR